MNQLRMEIIPNISIHRSEYSFPKSALPAGNIVSGDQPAPCNDKLKYYQLVLILPVLLLFSACSFNKKFLNPTKLPPATRSMKLSSGVQDTLEILFAPDTYQPTFIKNGTDTVHFPFSIESVVFKSADGNILNGWLLKPLNTVPTVTLLHFHGNEGFLVSQFQAISPLVQFGFQIFVFDYSGFGFSQGKATAKNVLIDGNAALTYLKSRADLNNTQLVIYGQSLGGHLSAVVAAQRQADIDALVLEGAYTSPGDMAAKQAGFIGRILVHQRYSAIRSIEKYNKPVLVIHSSEDQTIPFEMGRKLFKHAHEPKDFYEIKRCHICGPRYYTDSISSKITAMLQQHL